MIRAINMPTTYNEAKLVYDWGSRSVYRHLKVEKVYLPLHLRYNNQGKDTLKEIPVKRKSYSA
jgi:hypothetical protein